jgi:hypothetical protein
MFIQILTRCRRFLFKVMADEGIKPFLRGS